VATSAASIPVTSSVVDPGASSISPASPKISLAPTDGKSQTFEGCGRCAVCFWTGEPSVISFSSVKELSTKEPGRTLETQELARIAGKGEGGLFCWGCNDPFVRGRIF
jgi:hypothetical protein